MGSSMGGLISQYAMSQYPDVLAAPGASRRIGRRATASRSTTSPRTCRTRPRTGTGSTTAPPRSTRCTSRTRSAPTRSCARPATSKARTGSRASSKAPSTQRKRGACASTSRWCSCSGAECVVSRRCGAPLPGQCGPSCSTRRWRAPRAECRCVESALPLSVAPPAPARSDSSTAPCGQVDPCARHERHPRHVRATGRLHRIEAQRREHEPRAHLAAIVVADDAVRAVR